MNVPRASRQQLEQNAAGVVAGLRSVAGAVEASTLDGALVELVKIRVSQINDCAYCVQFHVNKAREINLSQQKLDHLAAWQNSDRFSEGERAALQWAEVLTRTPTPRLTEDAWRNLERHFDTSQRIHLTAAIGLMNAWNRVMAGLNIEPPEARA